MEMIEWRCPMAPLLSVSEQSAMSELLSARSKPPRNPLGHILMSKNRYRKKILKYIWSTNEDGQNFLYKDEQANIF